MWELQPSWAVMHLRCRPAEERTQGQQSQSHLRAARDAETVGLGSDDARREEQLWKPTGITAVLPQGVGSAITGTNRRLHRGFLHADVPYHAHPV